MSTGAANDDLPTEVRSVAGAELEVVGFGPKPMVVVPALATLPSAAPTEAGAPNPTVVVAAMDDASFSASFVAVSTQQQCHGRYLCGLGELTVVTVYLRLVNLAD